MLVFPWIFSLFRNFLETRFSSFKTQGHPPLGIGSYWFIGIRCDTLRFTWCTDVVGLCAG